MKSLALITFALLFSLLACKAEAEVEVLDKVDGSSIVYKEAGPYRAEVTGMTCSRCAATVKGRFERHDGVKNVVVDHEKNQVLFELADAIRLEHEALSKTLQKGGTNYRLGSVSRVD